MKQILAIAKLKLLQTRSNWGIIVMMTISPILFTFMIGSLNFNDTVDQVFIYMNDQDQSQISTELVQSLNSEPYHVQILDEAEIFQLVREKKIKAGYIIPEGFGDQIIQGQTAEIGVVQSPEETSHQEIPILINNQALRIQSTQQTTQLVFSTLGNSDQTISQRVDQLMQESWANPKLTSTYVPVNSDSTFVYDQKAQASMGYLIFFLMFTLTFSISEILTEKDLGTWRRLLSTPIRSSQILLGHFIGTMTLGVLQVILLVSFGSLVMGVQWGQSPLGVVLILFSLIFALTSLGLLLSGLIKTRRQLGALTPVLVVSTSMLGGCMWPLEIVPDFMKTVARFVPQGQAMMGLTELVMRGSGIDQALPPTLALLTMGVIFFVIGLPRVRQKM